jgi:hypothetical protein
VGGCGAGVGSQPAASSETARRRTPFTGNRYLSMAASHSNTSRRIGAGSW